MDVCIVIHRIYTFHIYLQEHVIVCISVLVSNVFLNCNCRILYLAIFVNVCYSVHNLYNVK